MSRPGRPWPAHWPPTWLSRWTVVLVAAGAVLVLAVAVLVLGPDDDPVLSPSTPTTPTAEEFPAVAPSDAAPARDGVRLPEQWHPFRPTRLQLRPDDSGPDAPVDAVATRADGELTLPENPDRVGWWAGGSRAGAPFGPVVLAGHVDSRRFGLGFLAQMSSLRRGELVRVGDGRRHLDYRVTGSRLVDADALGREAALFAPRGAGRLVLITCGGPYDRAQGRYTQNLVVEAEPVA